MRPLLDRNWDSSPLNWIPSFVPLAAALFIAGLGYQSLLSVQLYHIIHQLVAFFTTHLLYQFVTFFTTHLLNQLVTFFTSHLLFLLRSCFPFLQIYLKNTNGFILNCWFEIWISIGYLKISICYRRLSG